MSVLVYAEHDNAALNKVTLSVVAAAKEIGGDITVLVAGKGCGAVAEEAAKIDGVSKVLCADNDAYEHQLAENIGDLVAEVGADYSHILAAATTTGKNFAPRAAALHTAGPRPRARGPAAPDHQRRQAHSLTAHRLDWRAAVWAAGGSARTGLCPPPPPQAPLARTYLSERGRTPSIERRELRCSAHRWSSGRILPCHGRDPSSILGRCSWLRFCFFCVFGGARARF